MALCLAVVALCVLGSISTSALAAPPPPPSMLAQQLASAAAIEQSLYAAGLFNMTAGLLNSTGLSSALGFGVNLTLLAPSDDAWFNVTTQPRGVDLMQALKGPNAKLVLVNTLLYHVIPSYYTSATLQATTSDSSLPSLLGDGVFVSTAVGQSLFYTNITNKKDVATDFAPDLYTDYIVSIQGIDKVLIPKNFSILFDPEFLISIPAAPAPGGAPTAAPAPGRAPTAAPAPAPVAAPKAAPKAGSLSPPSASSIPPSSSTSSGNSTSPNTPSATSSAGFVAVNAVATFAALLVSVAALL